ncbi:glucan biosynthesis protein [Candidatus Methylospira mobilis]|uniref:Glucan biosynthesis protein n=1 Tax=Candidatus Methylospira mobilis TaxID=1808979 RepID=A0A5Q0BM22_9GAMM|nr:glucan biosynthesis protein G [Candidatus Methylospira mobilis]QFY44810.1 glucan biosynthesis protein [Candidatus Methylospira mobilis]WNV05645.1 glucan biosynthesis protein G [Candidatus Methylospira mobilis]
MRKPIAMFWLCMLFLFTRLALAEEGAQPPVAALQPRVFAFAEVEQQAKDLATRPYAKDDGGLPEFLGKLDADQYRAINFRQDKSLWRDEGLPFQVQFYHRGFIFRNRVNVNVVEQGNAARLAYSPELFDFGKNSPQGPLPADLGFAGLRFHYPLHRDGNPDEFAVFLGASYFRAVGLGQIYGISARGLAIDTGLPKAEEFPVFKEFWIEKPARQSDQLVVYALLDSPSATGAYRFVIHPGMEIGMEVSAHIYARKGTERIGIAPLTSMFFHGENTDRFFDDTRPEVHDSDGLLTLRSNGERVWRPLNNPKHLRISVFRDQNPRGFGLMTRDRNFEHYQDLGSHYEQRPSAWIETIGNWGAGSVYLIEIPSDAEKYDNIVAFWVPDQPMDGTRDFSFQYRLHFRPDEPAAPDLAHVNETRIGSSLLSGAETDARHFVVDFQGDAMNRYGDKALIDADISASSGQVSHVSVQKNITTGGWRLSFDLTPEKDKDPVELRAVLKSKEDILTETWVYQWSRW